MTRHYEAELQEALDERLGAAGRAELDTHLAACAACRATYERLRWVKEAVARAHQDEEAPPGLGARIRGVLDEEDRAPHVPSRRLEHGAPAVATAGRLAYRRWVLAAAVLLAVGAGLLSLRRAGAPDVAAAMVQDFERYQSGALTLAAVTTDPARLHAVFAARGGGFAVRVLDLDMMGYRLVGGGPHVLAGRPSALLVYRADSGRVLVCEMYVGEAAVVARGAEVREHGGITFYVHRVAGRTVVFWQEAQVVCALVSDGDPDAVIRLAIEKAMKAA